MQYVAINCGLNQTISVNKETLVQIATDAVKETKYVKIHGEPRISFNKDQSNCSFAIDVKIKSGAALGQTINSLINEISKRYETLLEMKPENISVSFISNY
ncbi:MMB_0454 family protein [Mycoplasma sp. Mirounga ES2805-ORL]|uniref:MMB_0454 family protein n=1 Tax=Mycoplasma sp. Mirounga ES2805-ORL TaxID=754514 RepID=UPI00197CA23A|nr:hypothetical protein [Mycoplasma sp. Mirounga ES2805-ORL]QSF13379.1 hypothetical protein JXZ90_01725 [Mycoplasma sp. Mirounga ES2805-ORL]